MSVQRSRPSVGVGYAGVRLFADRLKDVPKEMRTSLRRTIREIGSDLTDEIRRQSVWSSRIPGAVEMKVGFGSRGGVRVSVNASKAPHARVNEFPNSGTMIRFPVYGNREVWAETPARPFFFKAIAAKEASAVTKIGEAIDEAISRI